METTESTKLNCLKGNIEYIGTFIGMLQDRQTKPIVPKYLQNYDISVSSEDKIYIQNKYIESFYSKKGTLLRRVGLQEEVDKDEFGLRNNVWTLNGTIMNRHLYRTKFKDYIFEFIKDNKKILNEYSYFGDFIQCIENIKEDQLEYQIFSQDGKIESCNYNIADIPQKIPIEYPLSASCKIDMTNKIIYLYYYDFEEEYEYDEILEEVVVKLDNKLDLTGTENFPGWFRKITLFYNDYGLLEKKLEEEFYNVNRTYREAETIPYYSSHTHDNLYCRYNTDHLLIEIKSDKYKFKLSNFDEYLNPKEIIFDNGKNIFLIFNTYKYFRDKDNVEQN